ncbi:MAG: tetratricopeptide repeat protein [Bacteroidetes bacterium]|nr:tetratricopeptide repeat protein [Bacteroidota bacterium]
MKKLQACLIFIFVLPFVVICLFGCKAQNEEKVPITTTSETARENFIKARDLTEKLRTRESLEYYQKAIDEDPNFAMAYLMRAQYRNTSQESFDDLNKAISLSDKVSEGERLMILGAEASVNANITKEHEYYQKLVSLFPNDERAISLLGISYYTHQDYPKAIEQFKKATDIVPSYSAPYNMLGYSYMLTDNYTEAEKAFKKYIELIPDEPNPYDSYAELLLKMGKYDQSIENYQKALSLNPDFISSYIGLSADYMYKGNYNEARNRLQKMYDVSKTDNDRITALYYKAVTYADENKFVLAINEFEKSYSLAEKNKDAYLMGVALDNKGDILFESSKYNDALANYKKSIDLFNSSSATQELKDNLKLGHLFNEGRVALMKKDFKTAASKSDEFMEGVKAINNANQIKQANSLKALIALEQKKADECISALNEANMQNPYNLYMMGKAHHLKGDTEKAKEHYNKAINFNQIPSLNSSFARLKANKMLKSM